MFPPGSMLSAKRQFTVELKKVPLPLISLVCYNVNVKSCGCDDNYINFAFDHIIYMNTCPGNLGERFVHVRFPNTCEFVTVIASLNDIYFYGDKSLPETGYLLHTSSGLVWVSSAVEQDLMVVGGSNEETNAPPH